MSTETHLNVTYVLLLFLSDLRSTKSGELSSKKARSSSSGAGCPFNKLDPLVEYRDQVLVSTVFLCHVWFLALRTLTFFECLSVSNTHSQLVAGSNGRVTVKADVKHGFITGLAGFCQSVEKTVFFCRKKPGWQK